MSASQVETLDHTAEQMIREERPAWASLVTQAARALEGTTPGDPGLIEMLDYVAELLLQRDRPVWRARVVEAADTLRARIPSPAPRKAR